MSDDGEGAWPSFVPDVARKLSRGSRRLAAISGRREAETQKGERQKRGGGGPEGEEGATKISVLTLTRAVSAGGRTSIPTPQLQPRARHIYTLTLAHTLKRQDKKVDQRQHPHERPFRE